MLSKEEITREEMLESARNEVDSTTPTVTPTKSTARKKKAKDDSRTAKIAADKERAKKIFQQKPYGNLFEGKSMENNTICELQKELAELKQRMMRGEERGKEYT